MTPPDDPLSLGVATPERVALDLPVAGIGSRTGAYLIDAALLFFSWLVLYFVVSLLVVDVEHWLMSLSGLVQTLLVVGVFASQWIYWTACEVFWNGQTVGKRIAGIRVVREDGAPVGFFESAVRNLLRWIDFLPALYAVGILSMLVTRQHRRLGDLAAGTLLIRQARVNLDRYATAGAPGAAATLSTGDTELILSFLERAPSLAEDARRRLGEGLVTRFGAELPPEERARITASWSTLERFLRDRIQAAR